MKKVIFFLLLFLALACTAKVKAQTFTTSLDSLVTTFEVKNKKAIQVQPNTATAKFLAQQNTTDLLYTLDNFFSTDQYRKDKSIKIRQDVVYAKCSNDGIVADSFLSVIYILDIPDAVAYDERLKTDTFLKVKSGPSKVPEQFYINALDDQRLVLVSVRSSMYRDEAAAAQRKARVKAYLDWIRQKYEQDH